MTQVAGATTGGGARGQFHIPREKLPRLPTWRVPGLGFHVPLPEREQLPWIAGLLAAAALDLIDWPVALVVAIGHTVASNARNQTIRSLAEGIEAGV